MRSLIERSIVQHEHALGVQLDYLRSLADVSSGLFTKFSLTIPAATHRKHAPLDAWHLARIGATRVQDCGTCMQYVVNAALQAGASSEALRAALADDAASLSATEHLALRFGEAVAARAPKAEDLRERLVENVGRGDRARRGDGPGLPDPEARTWADGGVRARHRRDRQRDTRWLT